jgi:hypothetical protein
MDASPLDRPHHPVKLAKFKHDFFNQLLSRRQPGPIETMNAGRKDRRDSNDSQALRITRR